MRKKNNQHALDYLQTNGRPKLDDSQFEENHQIYRIKRDKNPIDLTYPKSIITELSCNWSKFIIAGDLLRLKPTLGEFIFVSSVKKIKEFSIETEKAEGTDYDGIHKLSCYIYHAPLEEDYSHIHIDIIHYIDSSMPKLNETRHYTKDNWKKGYGLLNKKKGLVKKFFKELREDYKFRLAQEFELLTVANHFEIRPEFEQRIDSIETEKWYKRILNLLYSFFDK